MGITYRISRDEQLIRAFATGIISAEDMHRFVDAVLADPDLRPRLRMLYDASEAEPDITILQLAEVAAKVQQLTNRGVGRIAIVVESRASYRMAKTFSVLARALGIDVEVFTELAAAEAWLEEIIGSGDTGETPLPR
jgi:hypothetical protein